MKIILLVVVCLLITSSNQKVEDCKTRGNLSNGTEVCLECEKGHYLNASKSMQECPDCLDHCEICAYTAATNVYVCNECEHEYRLAVNDTGKCVRCPSNCDHCTPDDKCTECVDKSAVLPDGTCKPKSKFWIWFFVVSGAIVALLAGLFVFRKYFSGARHADAEGEAYKQAETLSPVKIDDKKKRAARKVEDSD